MASNPGASEPSDHEKGKIVEAMPASSAAADDVVEEYPDPDEDDLDDLDDMLDEFSAPKPAEKAAAPSSTATNEPKPKLDTAPAPAPAPEDLTDEDFAKQFESGMAQLLGEIETSPEMQAELENLFKGFAGAGLADLPGAEQAAKPAASASKAKTSTSKDAPADDFQATIKKTMERMQASGDQATAAAAADDSDDFLAELMKQMAAGGGLDGEGGEEDFSKMLLGMMEQLTNKEILYEPMKELHDKFPAWMEENKSKVSGDDLKRYTEQQSLVGEIVARFERKGYTDENVEDREYIVERMHKMQAAGAPPPDLVGDMATAQEALGDPEEGCPQQ